MTPDLSLDPQAPNDLRFQFEIIKGLSESVREQTSVMLRMQEQQTDIVARLERIEAKATAEQVAALLVRVDTLEAAEHRREGAFHLVGTIMKSPFVAWLAAIGAGVWAIASGKVEIP